MEAYTAQPDGLRGQTGQLTLCFHCFPYVNKSETIDDQKGPQEIEEYQQKHTHTQTCVSYINGLCVAKQRPHYRYHAQICVTDNVITGRS